MTLSIGDLRVIASGLDHPEGIALGPDGFLYAGGEAGQVYRVDPADGRVEQIADTEGFVAGVCLDASGAVYVCNGDRGLVLRIDPGSGTVEPWCEAAGGKPLRMPNWPAFEADGSLIFSDSGSEDVADGTLVRVPPGGGDGELLDVGPLHFPNGLAVAPDGAVYLLETMTPRLTVLRDGTLELVCELPDVVPDGVALDVEGGVIVSCYYPFRLLYVPAGAGAAELLLDDPRGLQMLSPTNVCFYGEDMRTLGMAALAGQSLTAIELDVAGVPLNYPVA